VRRFGQALLQWRLTTEQQQKGALAVEVGNGQQA